MRRRAKVVVERRLVVSAGGGGAALLCFGRVEMNTEAVAFLSIQHQLATQSPPLLCFFTTRSCSTRNLFYAPIKSITEV